MPDNYFSINEYNFEWDEDKNRMNKKKHHVDFETAALVFNDRMRIEYPDDDHSEDEDRYDTIGMVGKILFVVYSDRKNLMNEDTSIRIITARYANKQERDAYNNNLFGRVRKQR